MDSRRCQCQQRHGMKPDGVCAVVGSCASGFENETNWHYLCPLNDVRIIGEENPEEMQGHLKDSIDNECSLYECAKNELLHQYYGKRMNNPTLSECEESSTDKSYQKAWLMPVELLYWLIR